MLACPIGIGFETTFELIETGCELRMLKWRCAEMTFLTSYQK